MRAKRAVEDLGEAVILTVQDDLVFAEWIQEAQGVCVQAEPGDIIADAVVF